MEEINLELECEDISVIPYNLLNLAVTLKDVKVTSEFIAQIPLDGIIKYYGIELLEYFTVEDLQKFIDSLED